MKKIVAIIISTKNRPGKLIELLKYYAEIKSCHTLYIGDASDSQSINEIIPTIKSLSKYININYKQYPEYGRGQSDNAKTVAKILEYVEEEYVVVSGDDDYFIPKSLDECVDFLENNSEYTSVHGYGTFIKYEENVEKFIIGGRYNLNEYKADSACKRLKIFSNSYSVLSFSVHRLKIFKKTYKNIDKLPVYPTLFEEILPTFMSAILGKSKKIDSLYLLRGTSPVRYKQSNLMEKLSDSGWSNSVEIFINTLSEELRILEGIDEIESKEIVKQGFIDYLEGGIKNYYCNKDVISLENIITHVLNKFKRSVPIYVKKFIRNNTMLNDYYDKSGQLSKASPYYYEFRSLLNNIKE